MAQGEGRRDRSAGQWAVIKDSDGSTAGCHGTEAEADAQIAALYANNPEASNQMSDRAELFAVAAQARAAAAKDQRLEALPNGITWRNDVDAPRPRFDGTFRTERVKKDGQEYFLVEGYASVAERPYEMWDWAGPYNEIISATAWDVTLKADPFVVFRFNHDGMPMANTRNGRLELWTDQTGFGNRAWLNPTRADIVQLYTAIQDSDVSEQSFMFSIIDGQWSEDFMEYRINQVDMDRGDVGPVTYGANPHTSVAVAARSGEFLRGLPYLPPWAAREALTILQSRTDLTSQQPPAERTGGELVKTGRSVALWAHLLADD